MLGRRRFTVAMAGLLTLGAMGLGCGKKDSASGGGSGEGASGDWKVGAYLSLSGPETQFGVDTKEGIELAIDEANKAGGAKGRKIKVTYEDNKSNPTETTNKVIQLIERDKVVALLGEVASSRSRAGGLVANGRKVPMITPSSTNPDVTKIGPFVFRVCFTDDVQGQMGARFIVNTLGKKKIGLLYASDDLYSSGLASEFKKEASKLGASITVEKSFPKSETNFTTYITELRDAQPEVIYAPIYYSSMTPIARQAKAAGLNGEMFVGGDGWHSDTMLESAGDEMEGAYFTTHFTSDVPLPSAKSFVTAYKERFKREPTALAAMGYDAAKLLADALGRSKTDTPDAIREAIQETKDFQGATGSISINADRNADKPLVIAQIKGKKFLYHSSVGGK